MYCKNCGAQLADDAKFCPSCGRECSIPVLEAPVQAQAPFPPKKKKKSIFKRWWFWVIIGFAVTVLAVALGSGEPSNAPGTTEASETTKTTEATQPQAIQISAIELHKAYEQNEVAAAKKYDNKLVEVTGTVESIGTNVLNDVYVTLTVGEYLKSVYCYIDDDAVDTVLDIAEGQEITISGMCGSYSLGSVSVKDCSIINVGSIDTDSQSTTEAPGNYEAFEISAADLFAAFNDNEVAANSAYKGKRLKVTGTINNIGTDIIDQIYITLETGEMFYSIQCYFANSNEEAKVASLSKGSEITIEGVCNGLSLNVILDDCIIP